MNGIVRADIKPGTRVKVVQKQDQRSGKLTEGIVKDVLTKSAKRHCRAREKSHSLKSALIFQGTVKASIKK